MDGLNWESCYAGPVGKLILEVMEGAEEKRRKMEVCKYWTLGAVNNLENTEDFKFLITT